MTIKIDFDNDGETDVEVRVKNLAKYALIIKALLASSGLAGLTMLIHVGMV